MERVRSSANVKERNTPYVLHSGYPGEHDGAADKAIYVSKLALPQHLVTTVEGLLQPPNCELSALRIRSMRDPWFRSSI